MNKRQFCISQTVIKYYMTLTGAIIIGRGSNTRTCYLSLANMHIVGNSVMAKGIPCFEVD